MAKRIRIGIIYQNNENWIGGTYYIQNLIAALCTLPEPEKPEIVILTHLEKDFGDICRIGYPHLSCQIVNSNKVRLNIFKRVLNKFSNLLTRFDLFPQPIKYNLNSLDVIFPAPVGLQVSNEQKKIYWIPDFQEQFLPHFFSTKEILNRNQSHRFISKSFEHVVFSSQDAYNTFTKLYPNSRISKYILPFSVQHSSEYQRLDLLSLKEKYGINKPYYFAPNQFWKHKNQVIILEAINLLKQQGIDNFIVAFSGKEFDYRNPDYFQQLKDFVLRNSLEEHVKFLGFIDRNEQLKLMSGAIAVVQASLFEGWSTVVEDAKAMNQWVIASDLPVHREQLSHNVSFFNPAKADELAESIKLGLTDGFLKSSFYYDKQIKEFANNFISIIKNVFH